MNLGLTPQAICFRLLRRLVENLPRRKQSQPQPAVLLTFERQVHNAGTISRSDVASAGHSIE